MAVIVLFKLYFCSPFSVEKNSKSCELACEAFNPSLAKLKKDIKLGVNLPLVFEIANSSMAVSKVKMRFLLFLNFISTLFDIASLYNSLTSPTVITVPLAFKPIPGIGVSSICSDVTIALICVGSTDSSLLEGVTN